MPTVASGSAFARHARWIQQAGLFSSETPTMQRQIQLILPVDVISKPRSTAEARRAESAGYKEAEKTVLNWVAAVLEGYSCIMGADGLGAPLRSFLVRREGRRIQGRRLASSARHSRQDGRRRTADTNRGLRVRPYTANFKRANNEPGS